MHRTAVPSRCALCPAAPALLVPVRWMARLGSSVLPRAGIVALGTVAAGCTEPPPEPLEAYAAVIESVRPDVLGDPPGGPLYLEPQLLAWDSTAEPTAGLHPELMAGLARLGLVTGSCEPGPTTVCPAGRGLYLELSGFQRLAAGRWAVLAHVEGRPAPDDPTVILGQGYWARLELERRDGQWTAMAKARTSPLMRAAQVGPEADTGSAGAGLSGSAVRRPTWVPVPTQ